uniref:C2 domain-containing protein n=1 Tax=Arcella intermedia TaxID=1963864 RepID=A0A6B2L0R0_9EUKA
MKTLETLLEEAQQGFPITLKDVPEVPEFEELNEAPPPKHQEATPPVNTSSMEVVHEQRGGVKPEMERTTVLQTILTVLKKQETMANNIAVKARDEKDMEKAKKYLQLKKKNAQDIELINDILSNPSIPPPRYHWEDNETRTEVINEDLALFYLELEIIKATHLQPPPDYTKLSVYVQCECPFPDPNAPVLWSTSYVNCEGPPFNPEFNFKKLFQIDRKKGRLFKTKKIVLNLWHSRFLFRDICLGRAEVKVAELCNTCTVNMDVDILDGKKPTGGSLTVQLRVRTPIEEKEIRVEKQRLLVIDKHYTYEDVLSNPSLSSKAPESTSKAPATNTTATPATAKNPPKKESVAPAPATNTKGTNPQKAPIPQVANVQPTPKQANNPLKELRRKCESLEWLVSNVVMEKEQERLHNLIATLKKEGKPYDHLETNLTLLSVKMDTLVYQIQAGAVTMEDYVEIINKKIAEEKEMAKQLAQLGDRDNAKLCLARIKWMTKELSGDL